MTEKQQFDALIERFAKAHRVTYDAALRVIQGDLGTVISLGNLERAIAQRRIKMEPKR